MKAKVGTGTRIIAVSFIVSLVAVAAYRPFSNAASGTPVLITEKIDESNLVTLAGNTRPEANAKNDRGPVPADFPMDHMLLQLRRSAAQERALERYIDEQSDPASPNYHHWQSAEEIGRRYGVAERDLDTITGWLKAHGFTVGKVYPNRMVIDFSGTASHVTEAFHTEIHYLSVNGQQRDANMSDPKIPAALAPVVVGVVSLNNFPALPQLQPSPNYEYSCSTPTTDTCNAVTPADLATIYNLKPLFSGGISGQGETIAIVEPTDIYQTSEWSTFRSTFGLASAFPAGSFSQTHPGNCTDPGVISGDEEEAILDAEWSSAAAPSAAINLAACASTSSTRGELIALENLLNSDSPPPIVSNSYGVAETLQGAATNAAINTIYQTGAAAGVSIFVAAGDSAAAFADQPFTRAGDEQVASLGITVNGAASTIYNVAVGGTDFSDVYSGTTSTYWSSTNGATFGSAKSYVPEMPWNDSCASELLVNFAGFTTAYGSSGLCNSSDATTYSLLTVAGGSGGPSNCAKGVSTNGAANNTCKGYLKPSWQSVLGNPNDGVRDLPDVSLFAADVSLWGHSHFVCDTTSSSGTIKLHFRIWRDLVCFANYGGHPGIS
jgi:hypothetical protein